LLGSGCTFSHIQVLCYLEHLLDIRDTPLNEIMRAVEMNPAFNGVELELVRRKVLKQKNRLKRERAKDRKNILREQRAQPFVPIVDEEEEEFKKQRNRISAQLSRDRKKEKVKALEELNRQLQEECRQQREENEKLRKQAQSK
jgi:hypothetical protein